MFNPEVEWDQAFTWMECIILNCLVLQLHNIQVGLPPVRLFGYSSIQGLDIGLYNIFRTLLSVAQWLSKIRIKWSIPPFRKKSWGQHGLKHSNTAGAILANGLGGPYELNKNDFLTKNFVILCLQTN